VSDDAAPRVVFDTVALLQAALNVTGPAGACLDVIDEVRATWYACPSTRRECERVLRDPTVRAKNPSLTDAKIDAFLARLDDSAIAVPDPPIVMSLARDPDDEIVLNLAIEVGAEFLVTRDRDLLDLMDASRPDGDEFRRRFPELRIVDPVAFLQAIRERE